MTFFAALVVSESLLPGTYDVVVDACLISANIAVALVSLYYTVKECRQDIGSFSDLEDVMAATHENESDANLDAFDRRKGSRIAPLVGTKNDTATLQVHRRGSVSSRRKSSAALNMDSAADFYKAMKRHQSSQLSISPAPPPKP